MATGFRASSSPASATGRIAARALTEAGIRALRAGQSRTDGALPVGNGRLVVVCTTVRGRVRRTWSFRVRKADQTAEVVIGDHPAISLDEARKRASRLIDLVRAGTLIRKATAERPGAAAATSAPPAWRWLGGVNK
jgi:hypothetical protein